MSKKFDDDFFGCAESCPKMRDRGLEIQKLNEKIREYKDTIRDLHQVDISDLKKTIRCLKERIEELECENERLNEFVSSPKVLLIFNDDTDRFELFANGNEIADQVHDALKQAERRIEELRGEINFLKLRDGFVKYESQIDELNKANDELVKRVEELEDDNEKLKDLRDHLTRLGIKKESEIVNLKEDNDNA